MTIDSVCAGDDCDAPHEKMVSIHSFLDSETLVPHTSTGYLPTVDGVRHTWDCILNGKSIQTITVRDVTPKVSEVVYAAANHIHFIYHSARY